MDDKYKTLFHIAHTQIVKAINELDVFMTIDDESDVSQYDVMVETLEFYANPDNYNKTKHQGLTLDTVTCAPEVVADMGMKARQALRTIGKEYPPCHWYER